MTAWLSCGLLGARRASKSIAIACLLVAGGAIGWIVSWSLRERDTMVAVRASDAYPPAAMFGATEPRPVAAVVRVQTAGGDPVAGATCDLIRPASAGPIDADALAALASVGSALKNAVCIDTGTTDAAGVCEVHGPPNTALAVRVRGRNRPHVASVVLAEGAEIVITVEVGAGPR